MALTIRNRNTIIRVTAVDAWVKFWLHCGGRGMSVSHCVSSAADMPFVSCYGGVEFEMALGELICWHSGQTVLEVGPSLGGSLVSLHMTYLMDRLHYQFPDFSFKACFRTPGHPLGAGWHNAEVFEIPPSFHATYFVATPSWWRSFEGHHLFSFAKPPMLA